MSIHIENINLFYYVFPLLL